MNKLRNKIWDMSRVELEKLVSKNKSFSDVLREANLSTNGGTNHRSLKKRIVEECISTSHFEPWKSSANMTRKKLPIENNLILNSKNYASSSLKKRLVKEKYLEDKCNRCGLLPRWNDQELTLQLEHKNGDHFDNRIENLEILCPNCHTQTKTYGSKRRKIRKNCLSCNKAIGKNSILCMGCENRNRKERPKNRKVKDRPTKDVLSEEVQRLGFVGTGKKYGVSDNAIRKWLK